MTLFTNTKTKKPKLRKGLVKRPAAKRDGKVPTKVTPSEESRRIALLAATAGLDKKATAVDILDVTGKVDYADFLVLMTGSSDRHVASIAHAVDQALHDGGVHSVAVEGLPAAQWVLIDFVDVVVHVFHEQARTLYDLDGLWLDAGRVPTGSAGHSPALPTVKVGTKPASATATTETRKSPSASKSAKNHTSK